MRFCTLVLLAVTFFLAFPMGQTLGFTIPQQPLSQSTGDATIKISSLQSKLTNRMIGHKIAMAVHLHDVSSTLANISSSLDESSLILSKFKHQLPNLEKTQMAVFWNNVFSSLKANGRELKQGVNNGLDNITQTLALMGREIDDMDLFLSRVLEEFTVLETELLNETMSEQKLFNESNHVPSVCAGSLSSRKDDEKENLQAIFKYLFKQENIFTDAYSVILSHHPAYATSHVRYTTSLNMTVLYDTHGCDMCNGSAQVKFLQRASENDGSLFEYEEIDMNCTATDPVQAISGVGFMHASVGVTSIWSEHP